MAAVGELSPVVGTQAACEVLGLPRSSFYRQQRPIFGPSKKAVSARALSLTERDAVLACLHAFASPPTRSGPLSDNRGL